MKFEIVSSVELKKKNGDEKRIYFPTSNTAIKFLDKEIRSDEFIEGSVKVTIKKG